MTPKFTRGRKFWDDFLSVFPSLMNFGIISHQFSLLFPWNSWILEGEAPSASKNSGIFEGQSGSKAGASLVLCFPSFFRIVSRSFLIHNLWKGSGFHLLLFHIKNSSRREQPRIFPGCFDPESGLENSFPILPSTLIPTPRAWNNPWLLPRVPRGIPSRIKPWISDPFPRDSQEFPVIPSFPGVHSTLWRIRFSRTWEVPLPKSASSTSSGAPFPSGIPSSSWDQPWSTTPIPEELWDESQGTTTGFSQNTNPWSSAPQNSLRNIPELTSLSTLGLLSGSWSRTPTPKEL